MDDSQVSRWDNMIKWRGEASSTIRHMEHALERQEEFLIKLENIYRGWAVDREKQKAEMGKAMVDSLAKASESLEKEIRVARADMEKLEDQMAVLERDFAKQKDLDATNKIIEVLKETLHKLPLKVAAIIITLLTVYEILQRIGLL